MALFPSHFSNETRKIEKECIGRGIEKNEKNKNTQKLAAVLLEFLVNKFMKQII